jgi:hypothetical protein
VHANRGISRIQRLAAAGAVAALLMLLSACQVGIHGTVMGSGTEKTSVRQTAAFTRVDLKGSMRVTITVGQRLLVTVSGDDNLIGGVTIKVEGETLAISNQRPYSSEIGLTVAIYVPTLTGVELSGSGTIDVQGLQGATFAADLSGDGAITVSGTTARLALSISGSGSAQFDGLKAQNVQVDISGDATVWASGKTDQLEVSIPGSGHARLEHLAARDARVSISGDGDVRVWAVDSLVASIGGSGHIAYTGNPQRVDKSVSGDGTITEL